MINKISNNKKTTNKFCKNKKSITEIYHYEHKQLIFLALFNILLTIALFFIGSYIAQNNIFSNPSHFIFLSIVLVLTLSALASSLFVALSPLNLAVVTKETIKIDHNQPLKWDDIEIAEEFITSSFLRRPAIALHLKKEAKYKLTFMQKLCRHNKFTPFSIPLYAMSKDEADKIRKIIIQKCHYEKKYK